MKKSKQQRVQIARENGAKSHGPATDAGKARSAQSAAPKLERFAPHAAILCNEDRAQFIALLTQLDAEYRPVNHLALSIVRDIAVARWQILRLDTCITTHWNLALVESAQKPATVTPELAELQAIARAADAASTAVDRFNRQIDHLQLRIARLERRLKYIHSHFPNSTLSQSRPAQPQATATEPTQPVENTSAEPEKTTTANPDTAQPLFVTENNPAVVAFYRQNFPDREIIFLPADDVANGIEVEDDMPDIPRNVN